jgi:hypothetical protein
MRRLLGWAMAVLFAAIPISSSQASDSVILSPAAAAAFSDVGRCLTSGKSSSLSVFYLIDNSGSLRWTDPDNERREILQGSVAELASFVSQGVEVEVSAHLFSSTTIEVFDWTQLNSPSDAQDLATDLAGRINNELVAGVTDWEEGLELAYDELASRSDTCQMLIWFTDGGINPSNDDKATDKSLANLCRPGVGSVGLGSGTDYGLMSDFRKAQIPVFGVLYSNLERAFDYFQLNYPDEAEDFLAQEKWLMSFMQPLVEGRGQIEATSAFGRELPGGNLDCAIVSAEGIAPPEQTNGAFLNASDPIALAYQFLKLGTQISGGAGSLIRDGNFDIPPGTAKFVVLVAGGEWQLGGPEDSGVQASAASQQPPVAARNSAGASSIEVTTAGDPTTYGTWTIDTFGAQAELFVYSGLTFTLDRDRSSKVLSEYPNTITGKIVRTSEFEGVPIDLAEYPSSQISVSYASDGSWVPVPDVEISKEASGEFSITNFVPPAGQENLDVRLQLALGDSFSTVESEFQLSVQDKNVFARVQTDDIRLSNLVGPSGIAAGIVTLEGPNSSPSSTFCFAGEVRTDDAQTGIEKVDRLSQFSWSFSDSSTGEEGNCFTVAKGEQRQIEIAVRNPTQADSEVVSVWSITSAADGTDVVFEAPIRFSFASEVETNQLVTWIVLIVLMLAGLLLPLLALSLMNFLTTRFLDVEGTVRSTIPVRLTRNGAASLIDDARPNLTDPWKFEPRDFLGVQDEKAPRIYQTGLGDAAAKIPVFPLAATWYEWRAPEGSRIVTHNVAATKKTREIASMKATEVRANMADNWALIVPDSELVKPDTEAISGNLVVFAQAGNLASYETKVRKILSSPRLKQDITTASTRAREDLSQLRSKGKGDTGSASSPRLNEPNYTSSVSGAKPPIPGMSTGGAKPPIPGMGGSGAKPPTSGSGGPGAPPNTTNNQRPPWMKG